MHNGGFGCIPSVLISTTPRGELRSRLVVLALLDRRNAANRGGRAFPSKSAEYPGLRAMARSGSHTVGDSATKRIAATAVPADNSRKAPSSRMVRLALVQRPRLWPKSSTVVAATGSRKTTRRGQEIV